MAQLSEPRNPETSRDRVKTLILKTLGIGRVAAWCGVREAAVYQWLNRGTDERPIPPDFVPAIINGAKAEGLDVDLATLWPAMAEAVQP